MDVANVDNVDIVENIEKVDDIRIPRQVYIRRSYFTLSEEEFFPRFRLKKRTAWHLLQRIENQLEYLDNRNNSLSPVNQLLLTLRTYAIGSHLIGIGDYIQCDKSTVSRIVAKVSRVIAALADEYIYMPRNELEIADAQNKFFDISRFPRVIGAVDGTHVKIQSQGGPDAEIYRNRKGYFSLNVQAVASADYLFKDLVARWPGSTHDSTIFNNSRLKYRFERGDFGNSLLLGDSGYMNMPYLCTPFQEARTEGETNYNRSLVEARVKVENLFGIWKRRFPIMAYGCRIKLENIIPIIVATAVLQNIAQINGDPEPPNENEVMTHQLREAIGNGNIPDQIENNGNFDCRRRLVEVYFSML